MKNLSIIIPVYNGEKYIKRCIESIDSIDNAEIIIVDDNSTDSSHLILREFAKKHPQIKLLHNEKNLGVSATRNKAIKIASAKYVLFLDIDDYLTEDAKNSLNALCELNFDYINFGVISKKNNVLIKNHIPFIGEISKNKLLKQNLKTFLDVNVSTWIKNKLYKLYIIHKHNIFFDEKMSFSEDMRFNLNFIKHTKNLYFTNNYLTVYDRDIPDSLSRKYESKNISEYFKQRKFLVKFLKDNDIILSDEYFLDCVGLLTYSVFKVLNSNSTTNNKLSEITLLFKNNIEYLLPYFNTSDTRELALKNTISSKDINYLINYKE